ncbi:MAG TPA: lysophospholipid acyltransferase family protein [Candidatus Angelobacter sp.]|nr:lysophospholipid acyltransferase family protein [Candidatus Angelobacter sp.]
MIRTAIGAVRSILALLFLVVLVPPAALITFPWTFITRNVNFLYFVGMGFAHWAARISGAKIKLVGLEKIDPAGTYIFMSNHVSNLDPAVLAPLIPRRTSVLAKKELWRIPILGKALDLAEIVPVERHNRDSAIRSIRRAGEVLRHGVNMTIYPEGTRSPDGRLLPFKKGPFHLAIETGFPIVPVTILGTEQMMPKGSNVVRSGTATLVFHPPIDPKQFASREELMEAARQAINNALPTERQ